jgi:NAD(P)-dependent dehydrogenase (short-subunit alcohol dehydrogenase family)
LRPAWKQLAVPVALVAAGAGALAAARAARRRRTIDFRDKVVLITGGSRGLGLLMARELACDGAKVSIVARDPVELDDARRELVGCHDAEVLALPCDIRNRSEAEWAVERTIERFGQLDVLVNNAGVIQVGPLEHMQLQDFEDAMAVHYWGPLFLILAALPHLRRQGGGRIVNISSIGGKVAVPHLVPYSASKFALVGLSNGLAAELAKEGIYVTTVCPGLMRTGSHVNARFKGRRDEEFSWFAVSDSSPLSSIDGRRAARQILEACRRGDPHLIVTNQARLATAFAAIFPSTTTRLLQLADRVLPDPAEEDGDEARPGWQSSSRWAPSILTRRSDQAAVENNELRGAALEYGRNGNGASAEALPVPQPV